MTEVTEDRVEVDGGKYTVILRNDGTTGALRYGQPWPAYRGEHDLNNLECALARDLINERAKTVALEEQLAAYKRYGKK